ncbi:MAG: NAD(P)-dependent oxidoreductase [Deltaproteobacteria bacterium]|jgi:nucleoside-diphosphate-sugar epimerase|nr:NAD(P)-dependent oxidoreductase [Deltaproteobacteria bacterium]
MLKVLVIGGSGRIGTYLVPKLVNSGYEVINVTRGISLPYKNNPAWKEVENVTLDREKETGGEFERKIAAVGADVVIDLINYTLKDTKAMAEALGQTNLSHYLFCSSLWAHGKATKIPIIEDQPRVPLEEYGLQKAKSEAYLHELYRREGFPETSVLPGQICGPGWNIINPTANLDPAVFPKISRGEEIAIANFGMQTLHFVHADDVAQVFFKALTHRKAALGESFHAVGEESITLQGYARAMFRYFGHEVNIKFLPWKEWCAYVGNEEHIDVTYHHIARSGYYSIEKAKRLLDYCPRHTLLESLEESVEYMAKRDWLNKAN